MLLKSLPPLARNAHFPHQASARQLLQFGGMDGIFFHKWGWFTFVDITIVVTIIASLLAVTKPGVFGPPERSPASHIIDDLLVVNSAVDQYSRKTNNSASTVVASADRTTYLRPRADSALTRSNILRMSRDAQSLDEASKRNRCIYEAPSEVAPNWLGRRLTRLGLPNLN